MDPRLAVNLCTDRLAALPLAIVYLTTRCHSRCVACSYWAGDPTDMPVERAEQLAFELQSLGTQMVVLSGGEPLCHPRWSEVAAAMRQAKLRVWLLTAGLTLQHAAPRAAQLCERITVSLDAATRETYARVRGVDAFAAACAGIAAAVEQGVEVTLRCTVQRDNYRELPDLIRLARRLGVRQISFLAVDVRSATAFGRQGGAIPPLALLADDLPRFGAMLDALRRDFREAFASGFIAESPEKLGRMHHYFAAVAGLAPFPAVRCNAPRFSAVIGADGRVQPCYFVPAPGAPGPLPDLRTGLNDPALVGARREIRLGRQPACKTCVCSMYRGVRALMGSG